MKIVHAFPPNYAEIAAAFDLKGHDPVFCYGDTIYNPGGFSLGKDLIAHENIHRIQQAGNPDMWWDHYLANPRFRLSQELEAYREQYGVFCGMQIDRNKRVRYLYELARALSSPLYGNLCDHSEAMKLIKA